MSDTEAKNNPASQQKLKKQRGEGNVAQSGELAGMLATATGIVLCLVLVPLALDRIDSMFSSAVEAMAFEFRDGVNVAVAEVSAQMALVIIPVVAGVSAISILASILYNKGIVFAMKPVTPQLSRVSPMAGLKRIYGKRGWVETAQSLVRLSLWLIAAGLFIWWVFSALFMLDSCGFPCAVDLAAALVMRMALTAAVILIIAAAIDMIIQKILFLNEQKMTDTEVKQEQKDQFGQQEVRQERNRLRNESRNASGEVGVEKANMCLFFEDRCIAIRFHPEQAPIPTIAARGTSASVTAQIRADVARNGFPEAQSKEMILATKALLPGQIIPQSAYPAFILVLRRMYNIR